MIQRTPHQQRIDEFMRKAGQDVPDKPCIPDAKTRVLRARLILEEALETIHAMGVHVELRTHEDAPSVFITSLKDLSIHAGGGDLEVDLEGVADGCADISVVTIGTLSAFGIADQPILEEVDAANLRKFGPGGHRNEHGKWIKPADWTPPNINARLDEQAGTNAPSA